MERNRPVTVFAAVAMVFICGMVVVASFALVPEHPIKTSLLGVAFILGGLLAITCLHFLMFVPLFAIITKMIGRDRKQGEHNRRLAPEDR